MYQKIEGIVLKSIDYGESNKIITIFSREKGKVGAVARGAKKPNSRLSSVSQPFTYGYFLCSIGSGLGTVQQAETVDSFRHIREDLMLTAYTAYVAELMDRGTDEKKANPFLFELLLQTLQHISEGDDPKIIKNIFEIKMLSVLGFRPILDRCSVCGGDEGPFSFSVKEGGLICSSCLHKDAYHIKISSGTAKLLKLFSIIDLSRIGSINVKEETKKELDHCISAYYEEYTGLYLKSKRFLQQMEKLE